MFGTLPPEVRRFLPPLVLSLASLSALRVAGELWFLAPDYPQLAAAFFACGLLHALAAWGLFRERFWARGFGIGALVSGGIGVGLWLTPAGVALSTTLVAVILLATDGAPGVYERRAAFLGGRKLDAPAARRLFFVALGLGVGLPALLGSPLAIPLLVRAPLPMFVAIGFGGLALLGLTRLASWCYFAIGGAVLSLLAAAIVAGLESAPWAVLCAAALAAAGLPLTGPVLRHLRGRGDCKR